MNQKYIISIAIVLGILFLLAFTLFAPNKSEESANNTNANTTNQSNQNSNITGLSKPIWYG